MGERFVEIRMRRAYDPANAANQLYPTLCGARLRVGDLVDVMMPDGKHVIREQRVRIGLFYDPFISVPFYGLSVNVYLNGTDVRVRRSTRKRRKKAK